MSCIDSGSFTNKSRFVTSHPDGLRLEVYNKRGTCEQGIKEGKGAVRWTRLSCRAIIPCRLGNVG